MNSPSKPLTPSPALRTKRKERHPMDQTRGPFETDKAGWHPCPYMGLRQWLDRDEMCGECSVEDDGE